MSFHCLTIVVESAHRKISDCPLSARYNDILLSTSPRSPYPDLFERELNWLLVIFSSLLYATSSSAFQILLRLVCSNEIAWCTEFVWTILVFSIATGTFRLLGTLLGLLQVLIRRLLGMFLLPKLAAFWLFVRLMYLQLWFHNHLRSTIVIFGSCHYHVATTDIWVDFLILAGLQLSVHCLAVAIARCVTLARIHL